MKFNIKFLIIFALALFFISGCGFYRPVTYSFVDNERENKTAKLTFLEGSDRHLRNIRIVDFEGQVPNLEEETYITSVILPAGRPLNLRVYIYWHADLEGYRRRGIFKCPPLEAGEEYRIRPVYKTKGIFIERPVEYSIILEKKRERPALLKLFTNKPFTEIFYDEVYTQVIPQFVGIGK